MSQLDTAVGTVANVTVSPQPSLVTNIVTSASALAAHASGASTPFVSPDSTPAIQGNAPVAAVKVTIGGTGSSVSAGQPTVVFANPS